MHTGKWRAERLSHEQFPFKSTSVYCEMKEMHSSSKANSFCSLVVRRVDIESTSVALSRSGS